ncbi:flavin reductase family protein [Chloroflexota bacterium]
MKIDPKDLTRGERHRFMGNLVVPRPIALVSTISGDGILNLAPFSLFNIVSYQPVPMLFFTPGRRPDRSKKDTLVNVQQTGEFVVNLVTEEIAEKMNVASGRFPSDVDEFSVSRLTPVPADLVKAPRVEESPFNMECRLTQIIEFGKPDITGEMILGEILRVHVRDDLYRDGVIDAVHSHIIGRMGWGLYTRTRDLFDISHPDSAQL